MFIFDADLTKRVRQVLDGSNVDVAVAFWGKGAAAFGKLNSRTDWRIICNLAMGGTNPKAIRDIENPALLKPKVTKRIKEHSRLHAKVYVSDVGAVVASANMSANGLGFEGREAAGWSEAGVFLAADDGGIYDIRQWFQGIWDESHFISDERLEEIVPIHGRHRQDRSSLGRLSDIDVDDGEFPILTWWNEDFEEISPDVPPGLLSSIAEGHDLNADPEIAKIEQSVLIFGRWILWCHMSESGELQPETLMWRRNGQVVQQAVRFRGSEVFCDVVTAQTDPGPEPFPITKSFKRKLFNLLDEPRFAPLLSEKYRGNYYTAARMRLMKQLWSELRES